MNLQSSIEMLLLCFIQSLVMSTDVSSLSAWDYSNCLVWKLFKAWMTFGLNTVKIRLHLSLVCCFDWFIRVKSICLREWSSWAVTFSTSLGYFARSILWHQNIASTLTMCIKSTSTDYTVDIQGTLREMFVKWMRNQQKWQPPTKKSSVLQKMKFFYFGATSCKSFLGSKLINSFLFSQPNQMNISLSLWIISLNWMCV